MSAIWFRVLRRARAAAWSTLVLAVLTAVVGAAVLSIVAGARRTASAPDRFVAAHDDGADVELTQLAGLPRTAELAALPAVEDVASGTFMMAGIDPSSDETFTFAGDVRGLGGTLIAGRDPAPGRTDEFVASESFVAGTGSRLGDTFRFVSLDQQQADEFGFSVSDPRGPSFEATLVGIATGYGDGDPSRPMTPMAVFPVALIEQQPIPVRSSVMKISLRDGATLDDLRAQIGTLPEPEQFDVQPVELVSADVRRAVDAQATSLWLLAAAGALAMFAALGQIASRRARLSEAERTSLVALGVTEPQLLGESVAHGAFPMVVGAVLAGVLAPFLSGRFPTGFVRRIDPTSGLRVDRSVLLLGVPALAVVFTLWIAASLVVFGRGRSAVGRVGLASRIATAVPRPAIATGVRFAFTRTRTDRGLALGSLLGVVAATAGVVGALTFGASLDRLVDEHDRFGDPFTVTFGDAGSTVPSDEVRDALLARSDVESVSLISGGQALVGDVGIGLISFERLRGPVAMHALEGRLPTAPDEVAFGRITARELGLHVGDDVELRGPSGAQTFRVTALAVIPANVGGNEGVGHDALVTLDGMRRLDPEAEGIGVGIVLRPGWTVESVNRLAEEVGVEEQLGQPELPPPIQNLDRVRTVPYVLAGLLGILGVLTIAHALLVSARNRRKDVAVLGALGADGRWVRTVVHWQAIAFTIVPMVVGVPLGVLAGREVFRILADRVGVVPAALVPLTALGAVLVAGLVLANLAALVPARRARRLDGTSLLQAP